LIGEEMNIEKLSNYILLLALGVPC